MEAGETARGPCAERTSTDIGRSHRSTPCIWPVTHSAVPVRGRTCPGPSGKADTGITVLQRWAPPRGFPRAFTDIASDHFTSKRTCRYRAAIEFPDIFSNPIHVSFSPLFHDPAKGRPVSLWPSLRAEPEQTPLLAFVSPGLRVPHSRMQTSDLEPGCRDQSRNQGKADGAEEAQSSHPEPVGFLQAAFGPRPALSFSRNPHKA